MDKGLWINWYDLPEDGRDAYFHWLHDTYIPAILKRPGVLWAAHYASEKKKRGRSPNVDDDGIPSGDRYILLFGAEHAHAFGDPSPRALHAALDDTHKAMLAMRIGERVNVMSEAARVEGPGAKDYTSGMALAPCIQLGSFNCDWRNEEEVLAWYAQSRMPAMVNMPAHIRTRRLASVAVWAKHAVLYEWPSVEARNRYFADRDDHDSNSKAWSDRVVPMLTHAPGSSNLARRIWPTVAD